MQVINDLLRKPMSFSDEIFFSLNFFSVSDYSPYILLQFSIHVVVVHSSIKQCGHNIREDEHEQKQQVQ